MSAAEDPVVADGPRLACSGVSVRFGGVAALADVDLEVPPGAIVGLVGPNGAGKSTLFGVVSGLIRPTRGTVSLAGEDVTDRRPQHRADLGLARTFQHPELFLGLTVRDHLVVAFRAKHARHRVWSDLFAIGSLWPTDPAESAAVDELLDLLGLEAQASRQAAGLPLGLARLVELGRALASSPTVLLLDEPSSGLDLADTARFESVVTRLAAERGISVLLVEHDVDLVMRVCESISVLDFGLLIARGTPREVRADPAVRAAYLGEELPDREPVAPVAPGTTGAPGTGAVGESSGSGVVGAASAPVPAAVAAAPSGAPSAGDVAPTLLAVRDLTVRYGDALGLSGVSFELRRGSALAVLGANGAGKSTLARALAGLVPATGSVAFAGEDVTGWPAHRVRRRGLVLLPEGRGVFRDLTVAENLRLATQTIAGRRERRAGVDRVLEVFPQLGRLMAQPARRLSGGEQQMVSLARALALSPSLLVADELSLGLAPLMVDAVFEGLERARQAGVTVMMAEQYIHRALSFADECLVLQRGTVAWHGPAEQAQAEVLQHYLGDGMMAAS